MSRYFISKNVDVPVRAHTYPWKDMMVGDSFFVPMSHARSTEKNLRSALYNSGTQALGQRNDYVRTQDKYRVVVRKTDHLGVPGFRAWLVASADHE